MAQPLILTLQMDEVAQEYFDRLRKLHFPPERNYLSAHLTLFHKLPGGREAEISAELRQVCRDQDPLPLTVTGLSFLGRGVAYELSSPELSSLRRQLARRWDPWLVAQDRQSFKPHVTVQNKVSPGQARALEKTSGRRFRRSRSRARASRCGATWAVPGSLPARTLSERALRKNCQINTAPDPGVVAGEGGVRRSPVSRPRIPRL